MTLEQIVDKHLNDLYFHATDTKDYGCRGCDKIKMSMLKAIRSYLLEEIEKIKYITLSDKEYVKLADLMEVIK